MVTEICRLHVPGRCKPTATFTNENSLDTAVFKLSQDLAVSRFISCVDHPVATSKCMFLWVITIATGSKIVLDAVLNFTGASS